MTSATRAGLEGGTDPLVACWTRPGRRARTSQYWGGDNRDDARLLPGSLPPIVGCARVVGVRCRGRRESRDLPSRLDRVVHGDRIKTSFSDAFTHPHPAAQFLTSLGPHQLLQRLPLVPVDQHGHRASSLGQEDGLGPAGDVIDQAAERSTSLLNVDVTGARVLPTPAQARLPARSVHSWLGWSTHESATRAG